MLDMTRIALAAALVLGTLATARAEDPETDPTRRFPPAVQAHHGAPARTLPFSPTDKHRLDLQK